jgi:hypothetical protein
LFNIFKEKKGKKRLISFFIKNGQVLISRIGKLNLLQIVKLALFQIRRVVAQPKINSTGMEQASIEDVNESLTLIIT